MDAPHFQIAIITKPQGIKGELRVLPTTDDPARFALLIGERVYISGSPYTLENARLQKSIVVIKLAEIGDRTAAESLVGGAVTIPAEKALPLGDDEYYVRDIAGLRVFTEDGEELGAVSRVLHTPANDVYVIQPESGKAFMLPAIKEIVRRVDISEGRIIVRLIDGLRELAP